MTISNASNSRIVSLAKMISADMAPTPANALVASALVKLLNDPIINKVKEAVRATGDTLVPGYGEIKVGKASEPKEVTVYKLSEDISQAALDELVKRGLVLVSTETKYREPSVSFKPTV